MSVGLKQKPRVVKLAELIELDITSRGLQPGDAYLNTTETARMLKVNTTSANKAMQLLVQRRRLVRRQRLGTIIADPADAPSESVLSRVHLLVHQTYLRSEGVLADGVIVGMQQELPGVDVQFNFLPDDNQADAVNRLISEAMRSSQSEGFLLVRSSLTAQRLLLQSGMPTVVFGQLHPSVHGLNRIDRDQRVIGRLAAGHLLSLGFRRLLVLLRERVLPGDHVLLDGIAETMASVGLAADAMVTRCLPPDHEAIAAEVQAVIEASDEPIGIIARSEPLAEGAAQAEALNTGTQRPSPRERILVSDLYRRGSERQPRFAHVASTITPEEIGRHIGRMLANQARQPGRLPETEMIPVEVMTVS
ncbi:MAG: hypothetical protein WD768_10145 [Phycisphaeraceae bacterium]